MRENNKLAFYEKLSSHTFSIIHVPTMQPRSLKIKSKSKVYWWSSYLFTCGMVAISKHVNHTFRSSSLFSCIILIPKLAKHPFIQLYHLSL